MFATLQIGRWVMSLTLSSHEQALLGNALAVAAAPLAYATTGEWRAAVRHAIEPLLDADRSVTVLAVAGEPLVEAPADDMPAWDFYVNTFFPSDRSTARILGRCTSEVATAEMLYGGTAAFRRSSLYNEFARPHRFVDAVGMTITVSRLPVPTTMNFYRAAERARPFDRRSAALLDLVRPVFHASVDLLAQLGVARPAAEVIALLDALPEPAALCDRSGRALHETPSLARLLTAEPWAAVVRAAIGATARTFAALAPSGVAKSAREFDGDSTSAVDVRGVQGRYELRGSRLAYDNGSPRGPAAVILVRRASRRSLSDAELHERFALTARELQVARLLAAGRSAREVAGALGISYYTARHHVEHVLAKVGVRSRAAVAAVLAAGDD